VEVSQACSTVHPNDHFCRWLLYLMNTAESNDFRNLWSSRNTWIERFANTTGGKRACQAAWGAHRNGPPQQQQECMVFW